MKNIPVILGLLIACTLQGKADRPNVIVVMTDDQGWGDLSLHGNTSFETPHLDRLGRESVQFRNFYVQPVCSPTRAEFLTGRYATRGGITGTSQGGERLDLDETTLADVLRSAGYRTGVFGKWHNGSQYPYHPLGRGFDTFYGFTSGHWGNYVDPWIEENGSYVRETGYLPDLITGKTIQFIEQCQKEEIPFFAWVCINTPHSPMQVPDVLWKSYADREIRQSATEADLEDTDHTRAALAMVENIDDNMGKLMSALQRVGIEDNTIVVFLSDNGPNGHRWNGGMRGKKGYVHEGGVRSPLFIRWKNSLHPTVIDPIAGVVDLAPTLCGLAGIEPGSEKPLDGENLAGLLIGNSSGSKDRVILADWAGRRSLRSQRYRYVDDGSLYDMVNDPGETVDVSKQYPEVSQKMAVQLHAFQQSFELEEDDPDPIPLGHPDFAMTYLPARDAEISGSIVRSNRWPNDSYFLNWRDPLDQISWKVEVLSAGNYAVDLWYAMDPSDVGVRLRLQSSNAGMIEWEMRDPHESPFLRLDLMRAPLEESRTKVFRMNSAGTIHFEKGIQSLILTAPVIQGENALELRMLRLTRLSQ